jgi:hypothetical protein
MRITIGQLRQQVHIEKIIIHSLDLCLYQASALVNGVERMVTDKHGKLLRSFNLLEMQALLETLPAAHVVLRQQSAYDEMVGQPARTDANTLEIPLHYNGMGLAPTVQ